MLQVICAGIWWLAEQKIVYDFKMEHPAISFFIQAADDLSRNQESVDVPHTIMRNFREAMSRFLYQRSVVDPLLSLTTQAHCEGGDFSETATEPEIKPCPVAVAHSSKYITLSQTLLVAASGIIVLGTGYFAANYIAGTPHTLLHIHPKRCKLLSSTKYDSP